MPTKFKKSWIVRSYVGDESRVLEREDSYESGFSTKAEAEMYARSCAYKTARPYAVLETVMVVYPDLDAATVAAIPE